MPLMLEEVWQCLMLEDMQYAYVSQAAENRNTMISTFITVRVIC